MAVSSGTSRRVPSMARVKWRLPTSKATRMASSRELRRHRDDRLLRRLDDEVPVRVDVEHLAGSEQAPGGQRQDQLASGARAHPPPRPPPLLRGEDEAIALAPRQLPSAIARASP